jgi:glyoxylase-like metal-dependent hydrolase (beta-lactamase superfamily II)
MLDFRVISIGTLAAHPLWGERQPVRAGHSTCTLIRVGPEVILVDPGLAEAALLQRLSERANIGPGEVTAVFLTSFHPDTHRGIGAFEKVPWYINKSEREAVGVPMVTALRHAIEHGNAELQEAIRSEVEMLERCREAPDELGPGVDVFPLPGVSPGLCGLLLEHPGATTMVCGDAVATVEHLQKDQVLPWAANIEAAKASFAEAVEIADWLILGRDNLVPSPGLVGSGGREFEEEEGEEEDREEGEAMGEEGDVEEEEL